MSETVQEGLDRIIQAVMDLKNIVRESGVTITNSARVTEKSAPMKSWATAQTAAATIAEDDLDTFEKLKEALHSTKWPDAVNKSLVCDPTSDRDKTERGRGIIELMIEEDLNGLKFLDAGCGEGHCAFISHEFGTKLSVGYDIRQAKSWPTFFEGKPDDVLNKVLFTDNFTAVSENGPYDVILLFDVLDHIYGETPVALLTKLANLLSDNGKIYIRTHPWTSRHATHLYHDLNKAFIQLVFTEDEIRQLIPYSKHEEPSIKVTTPIATYDSFVRESGLKVVHRREIQEKVEPFFKIPKISDRICKATKFDKFPEFQMGICFVDYVATKAK